MKSNSKKLVAVVFLAIAGLVGGLAASQGQAKNGDDERSRPDRS